jgi:hypothetical protein
MQRGIALLFLKPAAGQADGFGDWITEELLPQLVTLPGTVFAQPFTVKREFLVFPPPPAEQAVVVEIDLERADAAQAGKALAALLTPDHLGERVDLDASRSYLLTQFREEMCVPGLPQTGFRDRTPRDLLVFFLDFVPGREEGFHEWYDRAHIRDGLTLAGFATGQRFLAMPALVENSPTPSRNVAVYEIYGETIDTAITAAATSATEHEQTTSADTANMRAYALSSTAPPVHAG